MLEYDMIKHHMKCIEDDVVKVFRDDNKRAAIRLNGAMLDIARLTKIIRKKVTAHVKEIPKQKKENDT